MDIQFPGGLEVAALDKGFTIVTDQPVEGGGSGSAPTPFDLFLASIGTCAGLYALKFCRQRNLDTEGLALKLALEKDETGKHVSRVRIEVLLPPNFPEKYREAILRAVDQCKVKRHIIEPPQFEVTAVHADVALPPPASSPAPSLAV
ncbi:MAG TPA: OsmC family protein [Thermoanaerobaculia bacterium]|nr:OsmC family protein [Thermoanaerobaculia bacterium]